MPDDEMPSRGRRQAIAAIFGAAFAWPGLLNAQRTKDARTLGVLMAYPADDPEFKRRVAVFQSELKRLGWTENANLRIEERWTTDDMERVRAAGSELVRLNPHVILVGGRRAVMVLQKQTQSIPVVFVGIADPVGSGLVSNLAHPGGNFTGFTGIEFQLVGKMLELLKETAPRTRRA